MAAPTSQTPSLAAILQTLAASSTNRHQNLAQQAQQLFAPSHVPSVAPQLVPEEELEEGEYDPDEYNPGGYNPSEAVHLPPYHKLPIHQKLPIQTQSRQLSGPELQSRPPSAPPKALAVDPTTVTTWPAGLRHVTKLVSHNEAILGRIRKLISIQHQHEKQWWEGRNALLQKQKDRVEGRKKLDEVLKAVGGKVDANVGNVTAEDEAKELVQYDKKVHRACSEMHKATIEELKGLGIPFFGTSKSCLMGSGALVKVVEAEKVDKKLDEKELRELQKRMLVLLEELCQE